MSFPTYLETLCRDALDEKVARAQAMLRNCRVCPRLCEVNRWADEYAFCLSGRYARVGSYFPHFGEENCLRGSNGSGTIFFSHCNLRCVFCQNFSISQRGAGELAIPEELAGMMLELQDMGCHNINFVTPEHVVPQIVEALPLAFQRGLRLPIVYNTSGYDSMESLWLMEGLIDIYMPDFKFWDPTIAERLVKAEDYPAVVRHSIREMHRQVGDLTFDNQGLARRGLLVRHLVMPDRLAGTRKIMRFLAREISPNTYVNIMDQYRPAGKADRYAEVNRATTSREHNEALAIAREEGLRRFDVRLRFLREPRL